MVPSVNLWIERNRVLKIEKITSKRQFVHNSEDHWQRCFWRGSPRTNEGQQCSIRNEKVEQSKDDRKRSGTLQFYTLMLNSIQHQIQHTILEREALADMGFHFKHYFNTHIE